MHTFTSPTRVRGITLRVAVAADEPAMQSIILSAVAELLEGAHFGRAEVAAARAAGMFTLDSGLVAAGTYYVVEIDGHVVAGSGWSPGGAVIPGGAAAALRDDTAVMRASYVDPAWARRGLATLLARTTETVARIAGFTRFESLCTPPSEALRRGLGYSLVRREPVEIAPGTTVHGARMRKIVG
jgi:GNAT superfamily N-acetyltransferase